MERVSARVLAAAERSRHTEATFSSFFLLFGPFFLPFNWVLIMSAVVNSVFLPQDQG